MGPDRGESLRPQPLRAAHAPRPGRGRGVPPGARDRSRGRGRFVSGRRVRCRPAGDGHDGRHGSRLRRRLRRVHLRPGESGARLRLRARLGQPGRGPRDAPDRPRLAHHRARPRRGPEPAHPRRYLLDRDGHRGLGQTTRCDRAVDDPERRQGRRAQRESESTTSSSTTAPSPIGCDRSSPMASTPHSS